MNGTSSLVEAATQIGTHALAAFAVLLVGATLTGGLLCAARQRRAVSRGAGADKAAPRIVLGLFTGFGGILVAASLFAWIARRIGPDGAVGLADQALSDAIGLHLPHAARRFFSLFTHVGDPSVLMVLAVVFAAVLWRLRQKALMLGWLLTLAGNGLLNPWLKQIFERVRPLHDHGLATASGFSFPSGHSSGAMVTYGMLAFVALRVLPPRWHVPAVVTAIAVVLTTACSRVFLQVHFASDVVAGLLSGGTWLAVCIASITYAERRRALRRTPA